MSNTKREPLLSELDLLYICFNGKPEQNIMMPIDQAVKAVSDQYEAARAKDAELIQQLVDGMWSDEGSAEWNAALDAAEAAGFKPSDR